MIKRWFKRWETQLSPEQKRQAIHVVDDWPKVLKDYLQQPLVDDKATLNDLSFVALDFETTGVDAQGDKILSIGVVDLTLEGIDIASSKEWYICHGQFIKPETAKINGLTPQDLAKGLPLDEGMNRLLERITGKVILTHGCCIEKAFIHAYFASRYQLEEFPAYFIDTLQIEKQFSYAGKSGMHTSYQLDDLRRHYHLPGYISHSAASDALACAELFLVQSKKLTALPDVTLRQLMR
ncbi:DNA polymerase III subunit epsilon [Vibrio parahaemolyticus]|nr:exonuclease domain-containing protein [Vibrio parahaemolyticus]EHR0572099.1 DNA polymerase III subunit epsilon [Vibrio parahaemolyticus]EHR0575092.1 DNA polymerase III subunit epsilon [Vibrio parahaemolyticus]EME0111152.1 DNA polymerase III subunit epsilon [Vibrio parahaemolyticus]MCR9657158.1 exonuclease domain-containing protein [Vibrio parahaemolyticus]